MANMISIPTFVDSRGSLSVIEKILPFDIKRVYYIYNVDCSERGFHAHKKTIQALVTVSGSCHVIVQKGDNKERFVLENPNKCLILEPEDFHWMLNFSENTVLLVLASEEFDKNDYVYET